MDGDWQVVGWISITDPVEMDINTAVAKRLIDRVRPTFIIETRESLERCPEPSPIGLGCNPFDNP